jgi:hypothetical protein
LVSGSGCDATGSKEGLMVALFNLHPRRVGIQILAHGLWKKYQLNRQNKTMQ